MVAHRPQHSDEFHGVSPMCQYEWKALPGWPSDRRAIYNCDLDQLVGNVCSLAPYAQSGRFRFISCKDLIDHRRLTIYEYDKLPIHKGLYAAVSYPWKGVDSPSTSTNEANGRYDNNTFMVEGAEDGDPISIDVLRDIAWAAMKLSCEVFWLDRLSIIQTDKDDKLWQLAYMYLIYVYACTIVLPGGLQRLVSTDEKTHWIDRAWTLQEVLAPARAVVLYQPGGSHLPATPSGPLHTPGYHLEEGNTRGVCDLTRMLSAENRSQPSSSSPQALTRTACTTSGPFGWNTGPTAALFRSLKLRKTTEGPSYGKSRAWPDFWLASITRTSSRPVDMALSITNLFEIALNPADFGSENRVDVMFALSQRLSGSKPHWLTSTYKIPPHPEYSIFPHFPESSVSRGAYLALWNGKCRIQAVDMMKIMCLDADVVETDSMPSARLDDLGYLCFQTSSVVALKKRHPDSLSEKLTGASWRVMQNFDADNKPRWHDIILCDDDNDGYSERLVSSTYPLTLDDLAPYCDAIGVLIGQGVYFVLQRHAPERFHRVGYVKPPPGSLDKHPLRFIRKWDVKMGGPKAFTRRFTTYKTALEVTAARLVKN